MERGKEREGKIREKCCYPEQKGGLKLRTCLWADPVWVQFPQIYTMTRAILQPHYENEGKGRV